MEPSDGSTNPEDRARAFALCAVDQFAGLIGQVTTLASLGEMAALAGVLLYVYLLVAVFSAR